ncbi:hypothetical protein N7461_002172 [Penicillium sp. DV-2018c]|nr:hypothetical protein N7461_002172 [Penicillium sp. DV-2018c]
MTGITPKFVLQDYLIRLFFDSSATVTHLGDSAAAVSQELIELSARWAELGLGGSRPYFPMELEQHARDDEDFEAVQALNSWLTPEGQPVTLVRI